MKDLASQIIESPIFGMSINLNLLGSEKLCSFDCPYCNLGRTKVRMTQIKKEVVFPTAESIDESLREQLRARIEQSSKIDSILISGNGEPTLHPEFDIIVDLLINARNEMANDAKLLLLTNGAQFTTNKIVAATNKLDEVLVKLDAGNEKVFKSANAPLIRADLSRISSGCRKLDQVTIQTLFFGGENSNAGNDDVDEWIELVGVIKPAKVIIHTIFDPPADSKCQALTEDDLYIIQSKLKRKLNLESQVYYW